MRRTQRGVVFVLTLAVLTALVLVLVAASAAHRQAATAEANRIGLRRAELAARAGIQRGIAALGTQAASPTTTQDEWATLGNAGSDNFIDGSSHFRMQIVDAASLINLNTATEAQFQKLPLTQEQIDCLLDFREAGTTPRADGAKDEFYNALPNGYNTKLQPFETVDELLQVRDFTPEVLYQPQTNTISSSTPLVAESNGVTPVLADLLTVDSVSTAVSSAGANLPALRTVPNQAALQRILGNPVLATAVFNQRQTFTSMGQVLRLPGFTTATARALVNSYMVGNTNQQGRINLNTATDNVLNTIPNLSPDIVNAIISRQSSGFSQLGDVFDVPGYTIAMAQTSIDSFAVNSSVFLIRVEGISGTSRVPLEAVVSISSTQPPRILRINRPVQPDVATSRWGWPTTTTSDVSLKEGS